MRYKDKIKLRRYRRDANWVIERCADGKWRFFSEYGLPLNCVIGTPHPNRQACLKALRQLFQVME